MAHRVDDLMQQVLSAIDQVEQAARAAHPGPWGTYRDANGMCVTFGPEGRVVAEVYTSYDQQHIARHDPAAVLRRCTADRKLLAQDGPFCDCGQFGPPTNPYNGQPIPHHYDCSAYQAAQILAEPYGITDERRPQ